MPARPLTVLSNDAAVLEVCRQAAKRAGAAAISRIEECPSAAALDAGGSRGGLMVVDTRALAPHGAHEWALDYLRRNHVLLFLLSPSRELRDADGLARFVGAQAALACPPSVEDLAERLRSPFGVGAPRAAATPSASAEAIAPAVLEALRGSRDSGARERFLEAVADPETGLHSAEYWEHRLEEEFKRCNRFRYPLGLVGFALEGEVDDATLLDVAGVVLLDTRDVDVACRIGRDTYVALLPHTGPEGARLFAERVRQRIESRHLHDLLGEPLEITVRVAGCPDATIGTPSDFLARVLAPDSEVLA